MLTKSQIRYGEYYGPTGSEPLKIFENNGGEVSVEDSPVHTHPDCPQVHVLGALANVQELVEESFAQ